MTNRSTPAAALAAPAGRAAPAPSLDSCGCERAAAIGNGPGDRPAESPAANIGAHFDAKIRRSGPGSAPVALHQTTQALIDLLGDPTGQSVLELGCGWGGLMLELLRAGAAHATGVELSAASIEQARARFEAAGLAARSSLRVGDGATAPLEPHDWVVLDRVICCYPDAAGLLANSMPATRRLFAFSVPNSRGLHGLAARTSRLLDNSWNLLMRRPCTTFVHDLGSIERTLRAAGFSRRAQATRGLWYIAVYERG